MSPFVPADGSRPAGLAIHLSPEGPAAPLSSSSYRVVLTLMLVFSAVQARALRAGGHAALVLSRISGQGIDRLVSRWKSRRSDALSMTPWNRVCELYETNSGKRSWSSRSQRAGARDVRAAVHRVHSGQWRAH